MTETKNNIRLTGRLGADPQIKTFENGTRVARFTIAVTKSQTNSLGEKITDVQWHAIVAWGGLAAIAEKWLHKGTQVTVEGKLNQRSYMNKEGFKINLTEIIASEVLVFYSQPGKVA